MKNMRTVELHSDMTPEEWNRAMAKLDEFGFAQIAAEKKGKWEEKQDNDWSGGGAWVCSECGHGYAFGAYHEAFEFNYCPNCGARMEESE